MSKQETSQTQQFPFMPGFENLFSSAHKAALEQGEKLTSQWSAMHADALERTKAVSADMGQMATDSMNYCMELGAAWQRIGMEAMRKVTDSVGKGA